MQPDEDTPSEVVVEGEVINVDDELGLKTEEKPEASPQQDNTTQELDEKTRETTLDEPEVAENNPENTSETLKRTETPLESTIVYDDILEDWEK